MTERTDAIERLTDGMECLADVLKYIAQLREPAPLYNALYGKMGQKSAYPDNIEYYDSKYPPYVAARYRKCVLTSDVVFCVNSTQVNFIITSGTNVEIDMSGTEEENSGGIAFRYDMGRGQMYRGHLPVNTFRYLEGQ